MNVEHELDYIDRKIESLQKQRKLLADNAGFLEEMPIGCFESCGMIHFTNADRDSTLKIIKHFSGHWNKSYREDKVDYTHEDANIEIYGGEAPETCRIVEEEVVVPEHKEIRRRLVCTEKEAVAA